MPIRLTRAVKGLLIACLAGFIIQQSVDQFWGGNLQGWLALVPSRFILEHRFWQIFTYAFLHGDVMHLVLNLMMLVFLGAELEAAWGTALFLRFYFFCSTAAGLAYLLMQALVAGEGGLQIPMVGASGAIYGLLMAYGLIFGERTMLFMMLFPMKAKHFVWILAGVEFMSSVFSGRGGLASVAHLGGMAAGFGFLWVRAGLSVLKKRKSQKKGRGIADKALRKLKSKSSQGSSHLKLVIDNKASGGIEDDGEDGGPKTWH